MFKQLQTIFKQLLNRHFHLLIHLLITIFFCSIVLVISQYSCSLLLIPLFQGTYFFSLNFVSQRVLNFLSLILILNHGSTLTAFFSFHDSTLFFLFYLFFTISIDLNVTRLIKYKNKFIFLTPSLFYLPFVRLSP